MRHLQKGRRLGRSSTHRIAFKRNMLASLFAHERIITTVAKAKEIRPLAEKLITLAKRGAAHLDAAKGTGDDAKDAKAKALHARRLLIQHLGGKRTVVVKDNEVNVVDKLINDIGPRFRDRPGGYTRIVKRTQRRLGDAAPTAFIELLAANDAPAAETK